MTEQEAKDVLRLYQNWRKGKDCRVLDNVFNVPINQTNKLISKAIEFFAAKDGVINCMVCKHSVSLSDDGEVVKCGLALVGKCTKFEAKEGEGWG